MANNKEEAPKAIWLGERVTYFPYAPGATREPKIDVVTKEHGRLKIERISDAAIKIIGSALKLLYSRCPYDPTRTNIDINRIVGNATPREAVSEMVVRIGKLMEKARNCESDGEIASDAVLIVALAIKIASNDFAPIHQLRSFENEFDRAISIVNSPFATGENPNAK